MNPAEIHQAASIAAEMIEGNKTIDFDNYRIYGDDGFGNGLTLGMWIALAINSGGIKGSVFDCPGLLSAQNGNCERCHFNFGETYIINSPITIVKGSDGNVAQISITNIVLIPNQNGAFNPYDVGVMLALASGDKVVLNVRVSAIDNGGAST